MKFNGLMRGRGRRTSRTKPRQVRCFDAPAGAEQRGETVTMTATVVHLIGEGHRTIARLLDLIEREVSAFAAGETPDLDLLASILRASCRNRQIGEPLAEIGR